MAATPARTGAGASGRVPVHARGGTQAGLGLACALPQASARMQLLASCSAAAVLGVLLLAGGAAVAQQTQCDTSYGGCSFIVTAPDGPKPSTPDFDKSGHSGNPGQPGPSINIDLSQVANAGGLYYAADSAPGVMLSTQAGSGSAGTTASNNALAPLPNLSAGSGGPAGLAGSITVTMPQGSNVQVISGIDQFGNGIADAPAIQVYTGGGSGGGGGVPTQGGLAGVSQPGADGGGITMNLYANPNQAEPAFGAVGAIQSIQTGILAKSIAGNGGSGNNHVTDYAKQGVDGASTDGANNTTVNGNGGTVTINLGTSVVAYTQFGAGDQPPEPQPVGPSGASPGAGVWAVSAGGNGGNGGTGSNNTVGGDGGDGGAAGFGGAVNVTVTSAGSVNVQFGAYFTPAIWAQSLGGIGGIGASQHKWASGGDGGAGGDGGLVTIVNDGSLTTASADHAPGILAQSFGGTGQSGGTGGGWGASGGEGQSGGNGGGINVSGTGSISTSSINSPGILAQSVGGGGGSGGTSNGWMAVGGSGAVGGNGGTVNLNYGGTIQTSAELSSGMVGQSIGGGGGSGGDASSQNAFALNLVVGGEGAGGGQGGAVQATNAGTISTTGAHSTGMLLQAVGGGGGSGGAAYSRTTGVAGSASVSLGGNGGGGGVGGTVGFASGQTTSNSGAVVTAGHDGFGILGQSIGGGGGQGGAAAAKATTYSVPDNEEIPSVSISVSLAGAGGTAGSGSTVTLDNAGLVATRGSGGAALVGQSIGGGGGAGGDSSAHASAQGSSSFNLAATVSFGGKGGGGGAGGGVTVSNNGLIITSGESADGIIAQSIGGGGGAGGTGDGQGKATGDGPDITLTLNMGGVGGGGGAGGVVSATNNGAILTLGDGAVGVMAQAVGGGGGRGGGAAGTSSSTYSATVNIGANGGSGGTTWIGPTSDSVTVTTGAGSAILTFGASSPAIIAQSIAGGGGTGGKAASTIGHQTSTSDGGNGTSVTLDAAYKQIAAALISGGAGSLNQYNSVQALAALATGLVTGTMPSAARLGDDGDTLEDLGGNTGENEDDSDATSITVNVGVGGRGGSGGDAGHVLVNNYGRIGTVGAMSDGILAQAIGGGGGVGGSAISSTTSGDVQGALGVGGNGGGGGNGANVTVNNYNDITTIGGQSIGIVAQSIAGGGGIAGASAAKVKPNQNSDSSVLSVPISIGASGGGGGTAGTVTVTNSGNIETRSHDAIGILAQSIQGGGGMVRTRSSDNEDNNGGKAVATGGSYGINLTFGGSGGTPDNGNTSGAVHVTHTGSITTSGRNAYGILAQSIGGGGGVVLGGTPNGTNFFGTGTMHGSAHTDGVTVQLGTSTGGPAGNITTSGIGAVAVFAQSIGGGGGIAGDTGLTAQRAAFAASGAHSGNGGPVTITLTESVTLRTSANNTPVILAQSIGGGGGRITNNGDGAYDGWAGGSGYGGAVSVTVSGTVSATGAASPGIFAESAGQGGSGTPATSVVSVTVNAGAGVSGGQDFNAGDGYGAGVYIVSGGMSAAAPNTVENHGTITSAGGTGAFGTAIYSTGGYTRVDNYAVLTGSVNLSNGVCNNCTTPTGGDVRNHAGATLNTGTLVRLGTGTLENHGRVSIGGADRGTTTLLSGNLVQGATGRLVFDTDHVAGVSDHLVVEGPAVLDGVVELRPARLNNTPVEVLTATGGITPSGLAGSHSVAIRYDAQAVGNTLRIQPRADFAVGGGLGGGQSAVAAHLQARWDAGESLGTGFAELARITDRAAYQRGLDTLSGQTVGAISASRFAASQAFVTNLYSCPAFDEGSMLTRERDCVWSRAITNHAEQQSSSAALGYRISAQTVQFGGQREVAPNWFVGLSAAYDSSRFHGAEGTSTVDGDGVMLGAAVKYQADRWLVSGAVDAGMGWYDSRRPVEVGSVVRVAAASPRAWHAGLHGRVAYQMPFESIYLKPFVDVHATYVRGDGYTETGAGPFNLAVESESSFTLAASAMVEIGSRIALPAGVLRPYAAAGIGVMGDDGWAATARFADAPSTSPGFRAATPMPDVVGKLTLGIDLLATESWEFKLQYSGDFGDSYVSQTGLARLAFKF